MIMSSEMRKLINESRILQEVLRGRKILTEIKLSRLWQYIQDDNISFGILSAFRGDLPLKVNQERNSELLDKLTQAGYGYVDLIGGYIEKDEQGNDRTVQENSFLVHSLDKKLLLKLGLEYDQETVIYKDGKEFSLLSTQKQDLGHVYASFLKGSGRDNYTMDPKNTKDLFSAIAKGSHRGRQFRFNELQELFLYEIKRWTTKDVYEHAYHDKEIRTDAIRLL